MGDFGKLFSPQSLCILLCTGSFSSFSLAKFQSCLYLDWLLCLALDSIHWSEKKDLDFNSWLIWFPLSLSLPCSIRWWYSSLPFAKKIWKVTEKEVLLSSISMTGKNDFFSMHEVVWIWHRNRIYLPLVLLVQPSYICVKSLHQYPYQP